MPAPDSQVPVRVYMPPTGALPLPVTIWIHGGGWVQGSIETNDTTCRFLTVASGSVVVSVDYRLSPMTKFPGAVEDWLNALVEKMRQTLRDILEKAKFTADQWDIEKPRREWLYDY